MDKKHREYCIRLGNPFMKEDTYKEPFAQEMSNNIVEEPKVEDNNWLNNKKITNPNNF